MGINAASKLGHVLILLFVLTVLLLFTLLYHTESALPSQQSSMTGWRRKMVQVRHSRSPPSPHYYRYSPPPPHISHASPPRIPNVPRTPPPMPHTPPPMRHSPPPMPRTPPSMRHASPPMRRTPPSMRRKP